MSKYINTSDLIGKALDSDFDVESLKNENDIKVAPNFLEFVISSDFTSSNLFAKQAQLGVLLFEDYCPYCSDLDYIYDVPKTDNVVDIREKVELLEFGVCPKCKKNRLDFWNDTSLININKYDNSVYTNPFELDVCAGMRSGKTVEIIFIALYQLHRYLMLSPSPVDFFGKDKFLNNQKLEMTFVSIQKQQVYRNIWENFYNVYLDSPWFRKYETFIKGVEDKRGLPKNSLLRKKNSPTDFYITFPYKNIEVIGAAPNGKALRGRTRIFCVKGNTLVNTDNGLLYIKDFENENISSCHTCKDVSRNIVKYHKRRIHKYCQLETESGYSVTGSKDHLLLVYDGKEIVYRKIKDVQYSDFLILRKNFKFSEKSCKLPKLLYDKVINYKIPSYMNNELATLLGYILSNVSYLRISLIKIVLNNDEIIKDFKRKYLSVFGYEPSFEILSNGKTQFNLRNSIINRFIKLIGIRGGNTSRVIPWVILRSEKEHVIRFLSAFIDTKSVMDRNFLLTIRNTSKELISQIHLILLGLGILSKRSIEKKRESYNLHVLRIYGINMDKYLSLSSTLKYRNANTPKRKEEKDPVYIDYIKDIDYITEKIKFVKHRTSSKGLFVYDITQDKDHNFLTNSFISHNCSIDEIGYFDHNLQEARLKALDANKTYEALRKSLRTVRSAARAKIKKGYHNVPTGIFVNISSPSAIDDKIMELIRSKSKKKLTYHFATWEFNPTITKEELLEEEGDNMASFNIEYGAIPPFANSPFIDKFSNIKNIINRGYEQNSIINWEHIVDTDGHSRFCYLKVFPKYKELNIPRLLTVDTGYTNNSYAVSMFHYDKVSKNIIADFCLEISPNFPSLKGHYINFEYMYLYTLVPIMEHFNIKDVIFDRWNTLEYIHRLQKEYKTKAVQVSLKWKDFIYVRNKLYSGSLVLPNLEMDVEVFKKTTKEKWAILEKRPVLHTLLQILTVREIAKKVIKPKNGTDDLFRTISLGLEFFNKLSNVQKYSNYSDNIDDNNYNRGNKQKDSYVILSNRYKRNKSLVGTNIKSKYGALISKKFK